MTSPTILLRDVHKAFGDNEVLRGLEAEIAPGETVAILGASGSGKSVTLKTLNGLIPVDRGEVVVLGESVGELSERELVPLRRRVSYLFQGGALFDSLTVFGNVAFPLTEHATLDDDALRERVRELLDMVRLGDVEELMPAELSGGMRKRVALARALALQPDIILYDEPTTGLDPVTSRTIAGLVRDCRERLRVTSVVVTHDIFLVERVATRVLFISGGRFVFSGTVEAARRDAPDEVRRFFDRGGDDA